MFDAVQKNVKKVIDTQIIQGEKTGENQETNMFDIVQKNVQGLMKKFLK